MDTGVCDFTESGMLVAFLLNSNQVSDCVQTSTGRRCGLKLLVNSVVTTGRSGSEYIDISTVTDETGTVRTLATPIQVSVSKGPVYIRYSLIYKVDVNSQPREVVGTTTLLQCASDSSALSSNPTCGSLYNSGARVSYSEGFCCPCTLDQMLGLGFSQRGQMKCNLFSGLVGNGASVHCLRWGPIWYSVFEIVTPAVHSSVTVSANTGTTLSLDANTPVSSMSVNSTVNITAHLVGSFQWSRAPTDWGLSVYAVAPNIPASQSASTNDRRVSEYVRQDPFKFGFLVPQSRFDLTGASCNKIGVSYKAFAIGQGSKCTGSVGDCLSNQMEELWVSSTPQTLLPGQLCTSVGGTFVHNDSYRLSCVLNNASSDSPTQVMIEMNAKDISIVYNESQGVIGNISCTSTIVALVQQTTVFVTVENTGSLNSEFDLGVQSCNSSTITFPLGGTVLTISGRSTEQMLLKLEDSNLTGSAYACTAVLRDSKGVILDTKSFEFNITSAEIDNGVQGSDGESGDGNSTLSVAGLSSSEICANECSGFLSVLCFVSNGCWSKLGALVGSIGGVGIALALMTKFGGWSLLWRLISGICSMCQSSNRKRRLSESDDTGDWPQNPKVVYPNPYYTMYPAYDYTGNSVSPTYY